MFFCLNYKSSQNGKIRLKCFGEIEYEPNTLYIRIGVQRLEQLNLKNGVLYLLGDPVFYKDRNNLTLLDNSCNIVNQDILYDQIKGHYYWFFISSDSIAIGNSFGSIFPIYYLPSSNGIWVSSSSLFLAERAETLTSNKRNLLERALFNYPFFNSTWWEEISLVNAHHYLCLSKDNWQIAGNFEISDYFGEPALPKRDQLQYLADVFLRETELFLPNDPFALSFTGGFDSRTLLAIARQTQRQFITYSFGKPNSSDLLLPKTQAALIGILHQPIYLDQKYVENDALEAAQMFMQLTEYNGNLGRPHYVYAARRLAEKVSYIVTGNFGSELFRALHLPGVMMTDVLIHLFSTSGDSWKDSLSAKVASWVGESFAQELDALVADLEDYLEPLKCWEPNHRFYYFVWNEIFRKYFGPEIVMQSHFLNNRTPYLNLTFFKVLNQTGWAGVHARLFEKNKGRRMKGQLFYAAMIRRSDKRLFHLDTNKGYSPADVLQHWRLPVLAVKFARQKWLRTNTADANAVDDFFRQYHKNIATQWHDLPFTIKNYEAILKSVDEVKSLDDLVQYYSIMEGWNQTQRLNVSINL